MATCEANKLDYVNDPTNFQPDLTVRNAIRHNLLSDVSPFCACNGSNRQTFVLQRSLGEPVTSSEEQTFDVAPYVTKLRALVPTLPPSEQLREAVRLFSNRLEEVETQGTPFTLSMPQRVCKHSTSHAHPCGNSPSLTTLHPPPRQPQPRLSNDSRSSHFAYPALPPVRLAWTLGFRLGRSQWRTRGV